MSTEDAVRQTEKLRIPSAIAGAYKARSNRLLRIILPRSVRRGDTMKALSSGWVSAGTLKLACTVPSPFGGQRRISDETND